ncbi:iron uptake system protein EfeO [Mycolicibacterium llatzerense]|uniref:iron uptake system protein EfeO n=1 Tax=Mycolicibacterium llatzerense TaxID=280871 RepID=UPI0039B77EA9
METSRTHAGLMTAMLLTGLATTSACAPRPATDHAKLDTSDITVSASDNACTLSHAAANAGPSTFVVTNNGTKVTEFYVYAAGDRVMGEAANISPGLQRKVVVQLPEPGSYFTACKPGMIGDGIRGNFMVTGEPAQTGSQDDLKLAADSYKAYVTTQTAGLVTTTEAFVGAVKKGDVTGAEGLYARARTYYERIRPAAESFPNDLDRRINVREADLRPDEKWTGFHRLEKDLWLSGLQPDTNAVANQLVADVKDLDAAVTDTGWTVDAVQIAGRVQGVLDDLSKHRITGEDEVFSHTDLWDFQASVDGSRTAVGSVRPILDKRDPDLGKQVDQVFATVQGMLDQHHWNEGFVPYDKVTAPERQDLSRAIDALNTAVGQVQNVVAPR